MDANVLETLRQDEGYRDRAYKCSRGIWTIGYGTNLQTLTIDKELAEEWLVRLYAKAERDCAKTWPGFAKLDPVRQGVVVSMVYQLGLGGVSEFKKFLKALWEADYAKAAQEMLDSKWAREDSPERAKRHEKRMREGRW